MPTREEHPETAAVDPAGTMDMVVMGQMEVEVMVEVAMDPAVEVEGLAVAAVDHLVVQATDQAAMEVVAVVDSHNHPTTLIQCLLQRLRSFASSLT